MDPRLLKFYETELNHLREMGTEFAREYPAIAGRLGLEQFQCSDPYVERILEGFAFLAARVQLKMDAEFPSLIQNLLEIVYPHALCPAPSMAIVQFNPDSTLSALTEGYPIPRGTALRGRMHPGGQTSCEFRTAHDIELWPVEVVEATYFGRDVTSLELPPAYRTAHAGLRLRLRVAPSLQFTSLSIDSLTFYLQGNEELPTALYEQLMARATVVLVGSPDEGQWEVVSKENLRPVGFEADQALLPFGGASFDGYRLLAEYFLFRQRYLFVEFAGLGPALQRCEGREVDIVVPFDRPEMGLRNAVTHENFALHCTPAVNLFPKRTDPVRIEPGLPEFHIVPDRIRPLDLEIYRVLSVQGQSADSEDREFFPFYSLTDHSSDEGRAYYSLRRTPRTVSRKHKRLGTRTSYLGSDMYVSLVDRKNTPIGGDLQLLSFETLCTNRDLPPFMPIGQGPTDFSLDAGAPVQSVRCIEGPSDPRPSLAHSSGEMVWKLISHLSLNYHSINDSASLREILRLYAGMDDIVAQKQIDGVVSIESDPIVRQLPTTGPMTFGRGLELRLTLDETQFEGTGAFTLGAILERFFSKYVSINSFTETVLFTLQRQEIIRWPAKVGRRHVL